MSDELMEVTVEKTKVKGSNVPVLNQIMEDELQLEVPVGDVYSSIQGTVPVIPMSVSTWEKLQLTIFLRSKTHRVYTSLSFLDILRG